MSLSDRQQRMLAFIEKYIQDNDYPPTIREIGQAVEISSTSVVNYNLNKLQTMGLISRNREVSRGLRLNEDSRRSRSKTIASLPGVREVRVKGQIAAGEPISVPGDEVSENPLSGATIRLGPDIAAGYDDVFALRVKGDSMIDALVNDGDIVILRPQKVARNGEMVAAQIHQDGRNTTTLKHFYREGSRIRLQPANPSYEPIYVDPNQIDIAGRVVAVVRQM